VVSGGEHRSGQPECGQPRSEQETAARLASLGVDTSRANVARVYDAMLGGKDNFAPDRDMAEQIWLTAPEVWAAVRENRAFLHRAVAYLAAVAGVDQFIDVGAGLPGVLAVHEVARVSVPGARVAYVDNDPVVLVHARAMPTSTGLPAPVSGGDG
jgi:hypothetical protein